MRVRVEEHDIRRLRAIARDYGVPVNRWRGRVHITEAIERAVRHEMRHRERVEMLAAYHRRVKRESAA